MPSADANPTFKPPAAPVLARSSSVVRALARSLETVRSLLGLKRTFEVEGIRYTERTSEPMHRAISRRGLGRKEFEVRFPDGTVQRIRCTPTRVYADISGPELLQCYAQAEPFVRPGMRVLDAATGTGYGAAWLTERVGPSGAVVAVSRDRESIRYAQARYRASNVAFEVGWTDALAGEIDGAFGGVVACAALTPADDPAAVVAEWWRLVTPGGWMLVVAPVRRAEGRADAGAEAGQSKTEATHPATGAVTGTVSDGPRVFSPDELSSIITNACDRTPPADTPTPIFRPADRSFVEPSESAAPAPELEIATSSIVNYAAALVRKAARP